MPKKKSTKQFKAAAKEKHNNLYDYSLWQDNIKTVDKVDIICPYHGKFSQLLNSHLRGSKCKKCAQEKKEKGWLEKYGVSNPAKSDTIKQKTVETNLERYGVDRPAKLENIKAKVKQTKKERYNDENYNNIVKQNETMMDRYGKTNASHIPSIIQTRKKRSNTKYHTDYPTQRLIPKESLYKLQDNDWLIHKHHVQKIPLTAISHELNVDPTTVKRWFNLHNIKTKRYSQSIAENEINTFIRALDIETIQSDRNIISPLELDIYIESHNLAIEYCGLYWHADKHDRIDNQYHKRKHDLCKEKGIQLITIFEDEWNNRKEQVQLKLMALLGKDNRTRVYARKCNIINVAFNVKKQFFNDNHIQGDGPGSIHIGLEYDSKLVAVMSFMKQKEKYYLNRYATSKQVVGGFSKLLKHFQRNNDWSILISFADQRWSNGNLYVQTGWELDSVLPSDYSYSSDGKNRSHKFNYRRNKLQNMLNYYDPLISERKNCDNNGILRIWDCGKLKFIINKE